MRRLLIPFAAVLFVATSAMSLAQCSKAPAAQPASDYELIGTVHDIMEGIVDPVVGRALRRGRHRHHRRRREREAAADRRGVEDGRKQRADARRSREPAEDAGPDCREPWRQDEVRGSRRAGTDAGRDPGEDRRATAPSG